MIIRIAFFLLLGLLLTGANIWFVMAVKSAFFDRQIPKIIAPFRIIGKEDRDGALGKAMAHKLRARLALLQRELEERALEEVQTSQDEKVISSPARAVDIPWPQTDVPDQVFTPLDITLNIAGVEVGGLLSRFHRLLTASRAIDFQIEYQEQEAIIVGNLDLFGGPPLCIRASATGDDALTTIAYAVYQTNLARKIEHVRALEHQDFRELMETLEKTRRLNAQALSQEARVEDYQALLPSLRLIVKKSPRWREILRLTAEVAENAQKPALAVTLYLKERDLLEPGSPGYDEVSERVARLENTLQAATEVPKVETQDQGTILKQLRDSPWGKALLETLEFSPQPKKDLSTSPTIAVLGALPRPDLLPVSQRTFLREEPRGQDYETRYINNLVRLVLLVAPSAKFIFTSVESVVPGGYTETDIIEALTSLLDKSPDILLATYGPLWGPRFSQIFQQANQRGTLVVMAAFSPPPSWQQIPFKVFPGTLTVGGLTSSHQPAQPLPKELNPRELIWTLGQNLPTLSDSGRIEPKSGHSFAAAVATGLLWHIRDTASDLTPDEIIQVLNRTSRPVGEGLSAIDLQAVLDELKIRSTEPVTRYEQEVNAEIPDNNLKGIASVQKVSEQGVIRRIRVTIDISHTWVGDLVVTLISPQGQAIVLHNRQGRSTNDLKRTYSAELEPLIGSEAQGEWTLKVSDHSARDLGRLNRWALEIGLEQ